MRTQITTKNTKTADDIFLAGLFGSDTKPANSFSDQEWIQKIRRGLPGITVSTLAGRIDVPQKMVVYWLHTTTRTIQRTIEAKTLLAPDLSDRMAQIIRVYQRCQEVFKDDKKVSTWLKSPNYALGNVSPVDLLDTIPGMEMVLNELGRIEHGVFI